MTTEAMADCQRGAKQQPLDLCYGILLQAGPEQPELDPIPALLQPGSAQGDGAGKQHLHTGETPLGHQGD